MTPHPPKPEPPHPLARKLASFPLLLLAVSALAQTNSTPPPNPTETPDTPTLQVYSRETIVDVLVTDSKGQPVLGLKKSDFTIEEDGAPQPIRSFAEFSFANQPAPRTPPKLPPNVYTNFQATPSTGPVNILLIDALHSSPVEVVHSLSAADQYVGAMPAGTQLAVFWLAQSGLHILQGLTADLALLRRAVQTNRVDIGDIGDDRYTIDKITLQALNQIAAYVAPVKGRKNLLWLAPGAPLLLMRDGGYSWGAGPRTQDMTLVHHIMDTYELFTAEQIAVSPIDTAGVHYWTPPERTIVLEAEAVAKDTGGEAFYQNNDIHDLIAQAIHDGSHYYILSYVPPRQFEDGHYHAIKVKAGIPGLHLVYRSGYNSEDPPHLAQNSGVALMKAALEGTAPAATQLFFDVQAAPVAQPPPSGKASVPYDILYLLPQSQIAFADGPNGSHNASLQFDLAAYDIYGRLVANQTQAVNLPLTPDEYRDFLKTSFKFSQQVDLPPEQISLRLGILDTTSNKVGTLEIPIFPPAGSSKHAAVPPAVSPTPCPPRCTIPPPPTPQPSDTK